MSKPNVAIQLSDGRSLPFEWVQAQGESFGAGASQQALPMLYHPAFDMAEAIGVLRPTEDYIPSQVGMLTISDMNADKPRVSFHTEYTGDWQVCQGVAQVLYQDRATRPDVEPLEALLTHLNDQTLPVWEVPAIEQKGLGMPTAKTYESAYDVAEAVPPPLDPPHHNPNAPATLPEAKSNLLISGSRDWEDSSWGRVNGYVNAIVRRAGEENMRVIVGDNPQGIDWAVVNACNKQGVDCRVYGIGREPRNPTVAVSEHCEYVQVQKEEVDVIHEGGKNHEPDYERRMRLLQYTERDQRMVDTLGDTGRAVCIWNGDSPGTKRVFDYAAQQGKKADLVEWDGERMKVAERTYALANTPEVTPEPAPPQHISEMPTEPALGAKLEAAGKTPDVPAINTALAQDPIHAEFLAETEVLPTEPPATAFAESCELSGVEAPDKSAPRFTLPPTALKRAGLKTGPEHPAEEEMLVHYDKEEDTGLWIGVIEGKAEEDPCLTCVLAVKNLHESPMAMIAPVYLGESSVAHQVGKDLTESLEQNPDLGRFMGVMEGMARQSGTFALWKTPDGTRLSNAVSDDMRDQFYSHPDLDL